MWLLYQIAFGLALTLAGPFLLAARGRHYLSSLPRRLGLAEEPRAPAGALWIHAVSVGEVAVAATLVRALPPELPLLVTTVTPTGQERARTLLGERATVTYLPFDLGPPVRRFLARHRPAALLLVEGDLWPLLLAAVRRRGLPAVVVNGRTSDRSYRRMRRLRRWLGPVLAPVDRWGVQSAEDRRRLLELGVPAERLRVTGNLKFESPAPPRHPGLEEALGRLAAGRPILVAGSTMAGEEEQVLDAFAAAGGGAAALLVLAPRHPERWDAVAGLLAARGFEHRRRGDLDRPATRAPEVVLLDSLGELANLYRLALAAFIGGTLVPTGGHNPLEPARFGVAVAVGPSMENFREMAERFDADDAWRRVAHSDELAHTWRRWLAEPAQARAVGWRAAELVESGRGALAATLELVAPLLAAVRDRRGQAAAASDAGRAGQAGSTTTPRAGSRR